MTSEQPPAERILDAALTLAEADSWESLRLHDVARELGITLEQIYRYFPQKDDLAEAWFDRADRAVLTLAPAAEFGLLSDRERLHCVIMTWLDALAPHRRITREMLYYKFEFGHIHLQALGIMRISRTVQWFREAAQQDSRNVRRVLEEVGTTAIFLMTFARWLFDDTPDSRETRAWLDRLLDRGQAWAGTWDCLSGTGPAPRQRDGQPQAVAEQEP